MSGRIRSIKPETLEDEIAASLSDSAWRLWVGSWLLADDHGNCRANHRYLAAMIWQNTKKIDTIEPLLKELSKAGLVCLYEVNEQFYMHIKGWGKHQRIDNRGKPRVPLPPNKEYHIDSERFAETRGKIREIPREKEGALQQKVGTILAPTSGSMPKVGTDLALVQVTVPKVGTILAPVDNCQKQANLEPPNEEFRIDSERFAEVRGISRKIPLDLRPPTTDHRSPRKAHTLPRASCAHALNNTNQPEHTHTTPENGKSRLVTFKALWQGMTKKPVRLEDPALAEASRLCEETAEVRKTSADETTRLVIKSLLEMVDDWHKRDIAVDVSLPTLVKHFSKVLDYVDGKKPQVRSAPVSDGDELDEKEKRLLKEFNERVKKELDAPTKRSS